MSLYYARLSKRPTADVTAANPRQSRPSVSEGTAHNPGFAATLARLQAEDTALRQRMAELERLVGALKGRLLARSAHR
jgi:hypothetical protein